MTDPREEEFEEIFGAVERAASIMSALDLAIPFAGNDLAGLQAAMNAHSEEILDVQFGSLLLVRILAGMLVELAPVEDAEKPSPAAYLEWLKTLMADGSM